MPDKTYAEMTELQLERANQALMKEKDRIRAEQAKLSAEADKRATEAKVLRVLEELGDDGVGAFIEAATAAANGGERP